MEPLTLMAFGATFAAAQVGRKVLDNLSDEAWSLVRRAWIRKFGREPAPRELSPQTIKALSAESDDL